LARRAFQAGHEIDDDAEEGYDNQGNGYVHKGMRSSFGKWMVQGGLLVSDDDGSLKVESGNFRHRSESGEEQSTGQHPRSEKGRR
jgi:hypothetical protein